MANVLCKQKKFPEAKKFAEEVVGILDMKKKTYPPSLSVAAGFVQISTVYETVEEFETVISLLMRVTPILEEIPVELWSSHPFLEDVCLRIGSSLRLVGKAEQGIPYLGEGLEIMKKYGSRSLKVGTAYCVLGSAYFDSNKPELSAEAFTYGKDILDKCLGIYHQESIRACKCLYEALTNMKSYSLAMKILEEMIKRFAAIGPSEQDELDKATSCMRRLKKMAISESLPKKVFRR